MNRQKGSFRLIAALTAGLCLFDNVAQAGQFSIGGPSVPAGLTASSPAEGSEAYRLEALLKTVSENGELVESHLTSQKGLFILIQDAHLYEGAQRSIAALIRDLSRATGIRQIGLEGAAGELAHQSLSAYPNPSARKYLAEYFLTQGWINGAEYAALRGDKNLRLLGLEEAEVYERNRRDFLRVVETHQELAPGFSDLQKQLETQARTLFPEDVRELLLAGLDQGRSGSFLSDIPKIEMLSKKYSMKKNYTQLQKAAEALRLHQAIHPKALQHEIHLMKKDPLAGGLRRILRNAAQEDALSGHDPKISQWLPDSEKEMESFFKKYPQSLRWIRWQQALGELTPELLVEWKDWTAELAEKSLQNPRQLRLMEMLRVAYTARALLSLELDITEWEYYASHRRLFSRAWMAAGLREFKLQEKQGLPGVQEFFLALEKVLPQAEQFYARALQRDAILSRNARRFAAEFPNQSLMIVSGGFHTQGFREDFRKHGLSYLVIRPRFSAADSESKHRRRYEDEMKEGGTIASLVSRFQEAGRGAYFADTRFQLETPRRFPVLSESASAAGENGVFQAAPLLSLGVPLLRVLDHLDAAPPPSAALRWQSVQKNMSAREARLAWPLYHKIKAEKVARESGGSGRWILAEYWGAQNGFAAAWGSQPHLPFASRRFPPHSLQAGNQKIVFSGLDPDQGEAFFRWNPERREIRTAQKEISLTPKRHFLDKKETVIKAEHVRFEIRQAPVEVIDSPQSAESLKTKSVIRRSRLSSWRTWAMLLPLFGILGTQPLYAALKKTGAEVKKPSASLNHASAAKEVKANKKKPSQIKKEIRVLLLNEGIPFSALSKVQTSLESGMDEIAYRYQVGDAGTKRPDLTARWVSKIYEPSAEVMGLLYEIKEGQPKPAAAKPQEGPGAKIQKALNVSETPGPEKDKPMARVRSQKPETPSKASPAPSNSTDTKGQKAPKISEVPGPEKDKSMTWVRSPEPAPISETSPAPPASADTKGQEAPKISEVPGPEKDKPMARVRRAPKPEPRLETSPTPLTRREDKVSDPTSPRMPAPEFSVPYTGSSRPFSISIPTGTGEAGQVFPVQSSSWAEKFQKVKDRVNRLEKIANEGLSMSWKGWKSKIADSVPLEWERVKNGNASTVISLFSGAFWGLWALFSKRLLKYWPERKVKGAEALEKTGQDLLERAKAPGADHALISKLDDQLTAETRRLDQLSQKIKPPFTGWFSVLLTFLVEALTIMIPFALWGGPGASLGFVIGTYLFLRLGLIVGASLNEGGHWMLARKGGHENIAFRNHGLVSWMFKLLPLSWFFFNPYVELEEVPSRAQASLIREGGWGIAAAGIFVFWTLSVWTGIPLFAYPWVQAALWGGLLAVLLSLGTDLSKKDYHPRFYLCGIAGYFSPAGESVVETIKIIFELVRTISVRGGQAGGFVTVHDVRSKRVIWAGLTVALSLGAGALLLMGLPILGISISAFWILAVFAAIPALSALPLFWIESGEAMNRSRTTVAKRADLTLSMMTALLFELLILMIFFDRTTWTLILAHARYSTSSPDAVATQPHTWEPTTLYNLLFRRTRVRSLSHGRYQSSLKWTNPVVGHNGDLNGFFFLMLKKYISHNEGKLHPFLNALLQAANKDKGDTVNISGIMKLLTTQGDVGASFRLAHLFVVMQEPHEVLEPKQLERVTKLLDTFLSQNELRYEAMLERDAPDLDYLENVPASVRAQMAEDFFKALQADPEFSQMVPSAKQREFAEKLVFYYHEATPFFAMKEFAVLVDPLKQSTAGIGSADGTFGLFSYSAAHREVAVYKKGQSVSVAFDESYSRFWLASDRTPLNDGRARYRLDLQDDEIFRIRWDENGKLDWCAYSVLENKMIPIDQIRARMRDMRTDPVMAPRPSPYARFPMEENARKIPLVVRNAWASLFDSNHANYYNVEIIVQKLAKLARMPHLPEGTHILIYGSETDPSYGVLMKEALKKLFPALKIEVYLSDELAEPAVEYVQHPEAFMQHFQMTSETLVIPISNSGRSFDTDQVLGWLCTQVTEVVAILGDMDNLMTDRIGPGRVLSTGAGGLQTSESRTHVNDAMHALISAALLRVAEDMYKLFPNDTILKSPLNGDHVKALKAHWEKVESRIQKIAGLDRSGKLVHHFLTSAGKRIAGFSLESPITHFATLMFYAAAVQFGWVVFPTAILAYYGIVFSGFIGGLMGIALNYLFLYFFGRMVVTGLWRILGRALDRVRMFFNYHPIFSRKLLKRPTPPRIYIGEAEHRFGALRQTFRKATALGWENTPSIDAADMSQINHDFPEMNRGSVLVAIWRRHHLARQGADKKALVQARGNRSFQEPVFTIVIGHDLKPDSDMGDEFIDLEDGTTKDFYSQFGFQPVPDIHVRQLSELFFDSLERSVAEHVLVTEFARTLAFPWFTRWAIAPILSIPAVGWAAYLVMVRYPWLFRFYPYWATQPRTVIHTTATPTDMSLVQAELARRLAVEGLAKLQKVKPLPLPAELKLRAQPLVPLSEEVYQTGERKIAPRLVPAMPSSKPASPKRTPVFRQTVQTPLQRQLQELRLAAFLGRLEAEVTHGRSNGGVEPALRTARQELEEVRNSGYPADLITGFEAMVKDRLPELENDPVVRSELRLALKEVSGIKDQMAFADFRRQWTGDLGALADAETYVPALETFLHGTSLSRGAYVMVNPDSVRLIETVYQSLPRDGEFVLLLDQPMAPTRVQEIRQIFARHAGPRVYWRTFDNLNLWLEKEIVHRNIAKQEVLILSTEGNQEVSDAGVPDAVALAAAKLSERSWVVVGKDLKSKLPTWSTHGISEILSRLLESGRQVLQSA